VNATNTSHLFGTYTVEANSGAIDSNRVAHEKKNRSRRKRTLVPKTVVLGQKSLKNSVNWERGI